MRLLLKEYPDVYHHYISGKFVVQTATGNFGAVPPDMKLEQTVQHSKRFKKGIISQTSKEAYVTECKLVCDEVLEITNNYAKLIIIKNDYSTVELPLHYELGHYIFNLMKPSLR